MVTKPPQHPPYCDPVMAAMETPLTPALQGSGHGSVRGLKTKVRLETSRYHHLSWRLFFRFFIMENMVVVNHMEHMVV